MSFSEIRASLLDEALKSPQLLSDLAGLELYISETYSARSFVELLQNADDAGSKRLFVSMINGMLLVANDGKEFSEGDFYSLCRSASSNKRRGETIGYRGIGFKSVISLSQTAHLISGDYEVTFSRERSRQAVPGADNVPIIRIPHPIDGEIKSETEAVVSGLRAEGFTTFFIFDDVNNDAVHTELSNFDSSFLIFLSSISEVILEGDWVRKIQVDRIGGKDNKLVSLIESEKIISYRILNHRSIMIAAPVLGDQSSTSDDQWVVHSFLPTTDDSGIKARVQGNVSTDPSRTRVVLDEFTYEVIRDLSGFITNYLNTVSGSALRSDALETNADLLRAIEPTVDPRTSAFTKKDFRSELYKQLKTDSNTISGTIRRKPSWLNLADFYKLLEFSDFSSFPGFFVGSNNGNALLSHLNVKELSLEEVLKLVDSANLSNLGLSDICGQAIKSATFSKNIIEDSVKSARLWLSNNRRVSVNEIASDSLEIDDDYLRLVQEKVGSPVQTKVFFERFFGKNIGDTNQAPTNGNSPSRPTVPINPSVVESEKPAKAVVSSFFVEKWRSAEEAVAEIFRLKGYKVEDVSKQNIGYDYYCVNGDGDVIYLEVKKIGRENEPFTLTTNEEVVAREKGKNYAIALLRESGEKVELSLIHDPLKKIKLTRQCRQWVWLCEDYPYDPEFFEFKSV